MTMKSIMAIMLALVIAFSLPSLTVYANEAVTREEGMAETNLGGLGVYQYQSPAYIAYADGSKETFDGGDMLLLFVNGSIVKDADIFILNGRTMAPVSLISEILGAEVARDDSTGKLTITGNGHTPELAVPLIVDGQTFAPLRLVAESLDYMVEWYDGGGTLHGDGTGIPEAHYVHYIPQVMISRYPSDAEIISKQDAVEILREMLVRAYEHRFDKDFEPLTQAPDARDEETTLRYGITNLSMAHIMSENDRFYTIHFVWDFMIDKYKGTVILLYHGDVKSFSVFDPEASGALMFAG